MINKLIQKKGKPMDPNYKAAKMSMLNSLKDEMSGMMKDDLSNAKGMKKVEVAGSDPTALKAGLDKAKEMVVGADGSLDEGKEEEMSQDKPEDAASLIEELVDHEMSEGDLTPDKIDELIQMLQSKKDGMSHPGSDAIKGLI